MKTKPSASFRVKKIISLVGLLIFAALTFCLLGFYKADLLFRGQELSLFLFDPSFFLDHLTTPGGLLAYIGAFLSRFFYYPLLGAVIMLAFLVLLQQTVYRLAKLHRDYFLLSFLPACFLLLFVTQLDYTIYVLKIRDIYYSQLLGFLFALWPLAGYKKLSSLPWIGQIALILLYLVLAYPLAGFYALLGVFFLLLRRLSGPSADKKNQLAFLLSAVALLLLVPQFYALVYTHLNPELLYAYGLPVHDFYGSESMYLPLLLVCLSIGACIFYFAKPRQELKKLAFTGIVAVFLLSLCSVWIFTNKDQNLHTQVAIENAISADDWDQVLFLSQQHKEEPNRILILYRNLALWKKKSLCRTMFLYPQGDAPLQTSGKNINQTRIAAQTLTMHYGMVNYCYRWNMESAVSSGFNTHNLKYMLRSAILNGEEALAQKYAHVLSKTWFYKPWAQKELNYLQHPRDMRKDPFYADILTLRDFNNSFTADLEVMESAIHEHFMVLNPISPALMELKMASIMTTRAAHLFWDAFFKYIDSGWALPLHVQETALMIGHVEQRDMPKVLQHFDAANVKRYQQFVQAMSSFEHLGQEAQARLLKKAYGNTAWYYFYYTPRLTTS